MCNAGRPFHPITEPVRVKMKGCPPAPPVLLRLDTPEGRDTVAGRCTGPPHANMKCAADSYP